jgi:hypothetical protein
MNMKINLLGVMVICLAHLAVSPTSHADNTKHFPEELTIQFDSKVKLDPWFGARKSAGGAKHGEMACFSKGKLLMANETPVQSSCCISLETTSDEEKGTVEIPSGVKVVTDDKDLVKGVSKWGEGEYNDHDWSTDLIGDNVAKVFGGKKYTSHVTVNGALINGKPTQLGGFVECRYNLVYKDDNRLEHIQNQFRSFAKVTGSMPQETGKTKQANTDHPAKSARPANSTCPSCKMPASQTENKVDIAQ